jgi:RimJ/RimL family protein N-acetyltransferase
MKLKRSKQKPKKTSGKGDSSVLVKRIFDPAEVLSYLNRERGYSASAIAHLEADLSRASNWFVAINRDEFALCLISRSTSPTYIFTLGNASTLDYLLGSVRLPGSVFINCQPHQVSVIDGYYDIGWRCVLKCMMVTRENFSPVSEEARRLMPAHIKELNRLYKAHGNNTYSADQIRRGVYYGIWRDGQLAAVAGTQIISPSYGIAYVGNVLTHSAYRNQGLASACTSAVTADLFDYCTEVVLNVEPHNLPAIQAYASLGYKDNCMVVEAFGRRQGLVGAIITHLFGRLGPSEKYQEGVGVDG